MSETENATTENSNNGFLTQILCVVRRFFFLMIAIVVTTTAIACVIGALRVKTVYTAHIPVMFKTNIAMKSTGAGGEVSTSVSNDIALAKIWLPDVTYMITTAKFVDSANEDYDGEGKIKAGSIKTDYNDQSLIFTISYSDFSGETATKKLNSVIKSANENLPSYLVANAVELVSVQKEPVITTANSFYKYLLVGIIGGIVLAIGVVLIINALDDTIHTEDELYRLTGVSLIGTIEDDKR